MYNAIGDRSTTTGSATTEFNGSNLRRSSRLIFRIWKPFPRTRSSNCSSASVRCSRPARRHCRHCCRQSREGRRARTHERRDDQRNMSPNQGKRGLTEEGVGERPGSRTLNTRMKRPSQPSVRPRPLPSIFPHRNDVSGGRSRGSAVRPDLSGTSSTSVPLSVSLSAPPG